MENNADLEQTESKERFPLKQSIIVKNVKISSQPPTQQVLHEFFSFCGNIIELLLLDSGEAYVSAIVCFEDENAAKMSLLLNNALIHEKPITVELAEIALADDDDSNNSDRVRLKNLLSKAGKNNSAGEGSSDNDGSGTDNNNNNNDDNLRVCFLE
eukprot:TRINITY_DN1172_c1_g1_i3.p1 TRINITY_DN1172_c1_g1~~TRINITY_DN1172_c1_g1_i3.p1  ORF type:complete len:156 (+),score=25.57 TRINITY_DN1172_c1_g1_i3:33-500(+)